MTDIETDMRRSGQNYIRACDALETMIIYALLGICVGIAGLILLYHGAVIIAQMFAIATAFIWIAFVVYSIRYIYYIRKYNRYKV